MVRPFTASPKEPSGGRSTRVLRLPGFEVRWTTNAFDIETFSGMMLFNEIFKRVFPATMAVPESGIIRMNLSIADAATTLLGMQSVLFLLKDPIAVVLPEKERDLPSKLDHYALALSHARTLYMMTARANDPIPFYRKRE